jgi:hypothetical protein
MPIDLKKIVQRMLVLRDYDSAWFICEYWECLP